MRKGIVLTVLLLASGLALSQESIQADRPDQTETPVLVPAGMVQIETGFLYEKPSSGNSVMLLPTILTKYGVNDRFELRLVTEFQIEDNNGMRSSGLAPVVAGFKVKLAEENGIIPQTSFIGHLQFPNLASPEFAALHLAPAFRFVMQHTLNDRIGLSYNLGAEWDGESPGAIYLYTLSSGIGLTDKLGMYLEFFGFAPEVSQAAHSFDTGFTYLLNNDMMLDISGGFALNEYAPDYFASIGFSFRI